MTRSFDPGTLLHQAGWLKGLARGLVLDESQADDVVQQTWLRALERPPREPRALPAWLAAVARNEARQAGRSEGARTRRQQRVARPEASEPPVDDVVARAELHRELVRRVLALPEPQKSTVLLRYFEGLEPSEIARQQEVPAGTVRSRLKRGLDALRSDLDRECDGDRAAWVAVLLPWSGVPRTAAAATGGGIAGAAVLGAKAKSIAIVLALLLVGGLLGWSLLRGGAGEDDGARDFARNEDEQPILRGRADEDRPSEVDVREEPVEAPASDAKPTSRVALSFVDEEGRAWTVDEIRDRYAADGIEPGLTFVRDAQLKQGGVDGLLATMFGPADAWQVPVALALTSDGALAESTEAGDWRIFVPRPGAAPYLSGPLSLAESEVLAVEIPLPRHPRRVTVRLLDATTGQPLAGASVTPYHEHGDDQAFFVGPTIRADGAGEVVLPVYDEDLSGRSRGATWWVETDTHTRHLYNWSLARHDEGVVMERTVQPVATATGKAWLSTGEPAVGREVICGSKGRWLRTIVAEDGTWTITGIGPSDQPEQSQRVMLLEDLEKGLFLGAKFQVRPGETTEVDLGQPASPNAAVLVGRISAGDRPIPGVYVGAKQGAGKGKIVRTDDDGAFRIPNLKQDPAEVQVFFGDPRVVDDFSAEATAPMPLAGGTETRLDFALPEGAILLTLVDEDGEPIAGGVGIARPMEDGLEVSRFPGFTYAPGWGGRTGEDGTILLLALVPGYAHEIVAGGESFEKTEREDVLPGSVDEPARVTVRLTRSSGR